MLIWSPMTVPAKLDSTLMKEPRVIQGVPRIMPAQARRKPIPSMFGPNIPPPSLPTTKTMNATTTTMLTD